MLTKISLKNFKCFEELELEIAPLTLLTGLNGMGKSSVIQALLLLKQTFSSNRMAEQTLALNGAYIELGTCQDVLFEDAMEDRIAFGLEWAGLHDSWYMEFWIDEISNQFFVDSDSWQTQPTLGRTDFLLPPFNWNTGYISAERIGPRKLYAYSEGEVGSVELGAKSEFVLAHLSRMASTHFEPDDPRVAGSSTPRFNDVLDYWLQGISPGAHLEFELVRAIDGVISGFTFDREKDVGSKRYRATNVGFGLSYVLPVLAALMTPAGSFVMIENPEAHLHPQGQTKLGELSALAAKAGVQIIVETHSDHFMDGVRIAVRERWIEPKDVLFHYFSRAGSKSVVRTPKIDIEGRLSEWPEGFFDQQILNASKLLAMRDTDA